jgi:hypothetical protein
MRGKSVFAALIATLSWAAISGWTTPARAIDEISTFSGGEKVTKAKSIRVSRDSVTVVGVTETVTPVADIRWIKFSGEPSELSDAKEELRDKGKYDDVLESLEKVKKEEISTADGQADLDFYKALCKTKLAIIGSEDITPQKAGAALLAFMKAHPQHYTYYEANELLGDLLRAEKKYASAVRYYGVLSANKELKARADVLIGWTRIDEGKPQEAEKAFDDALAEKGDGAVAAAEQRSAAIGKAACVAAAGKPVDAIKQLEGIKEKTDAAQLNARLFNVLGAAYEKNKQTKEAIASFLYVDLIYPQDPMEHAEALEHLKDLWRAYGRPERGNEAGKRLGKLYPARAGVTPEARPAASGTKGSSGGAKPAAAAKSTTTKPATKAALKN